MQMKKSFLTFFIVLCLTACQSPSVAPDQQAPAKNAVASAHPLATAAGMKILEEGGNAFDAAIAVAAVLGVVEPYSAGIGGGGFWLLHREADDYNVFIDARETAPAKAHKNLYLNKDGEVDRDRATNTALSAGIPGQAAAFDHLTQNYGLLPLTKTLASAIQLANEGFSADPVYLQLLSYRAPVLNRHSDSKRIFLNNGLPLRPGSLIFQPELASTLESLANQGFDGFYKGPVARKLVAGVQAADGIWEMSDLANYRVIERQPISFVYKGAKIVSAPPPSSGGVALAEMFNILNHFELQDYDSVERTHILVESMRRAYRDRAEHLGDPDFYPVPVSELLDPVYTRKLADSIQVNKATPSSTLGKPRFTRSGTHTTHLSVLDKQGNFVSATLSINLPFGSGVTVPGTGVLLNNEMDDFSAKPGSPNAYGLVGSQANAIEPGKRPLSSMTPSFIEFSNKKGNQIAILGTPGGSRIITMVYLGMLEALEGKPPASWVSRPRFHHQYLPDKIEYEPMAFSDEALDLLKAMGHETQLVSRPYGNMQGILWNRDTGDVKAASDPRRIGQAQVK